MREIVLDTETTGLEPAEGHRIVEIGAVELVNHMPTGRTFHQYINPQRPMPKEAFEVHGLGDDFLRDKPVFKAVGQAFLDFIEDSRLVIHNAAFDMKFLNAELGWAGLPALAAERALDTLLIARKRFPGSPASLDALCRRLEVDNSDRDIVAEAASDVSLRRHSYATLTGDPALRGSLPGKGSVKVQTLALVLVEVARLAVDQRVHGLSPVGWL
jgi:DNA polymerase-3 subunit epsilon